MRIPAIMLVCVLSVALVARGDEPKGDTAAPAVPAKNKKANRPTPPPRPADSDAKLAEGWPNATMPGKIEVKNYPPYRSAVARATDASASADNVLFWPLFMHISKKGVEMTTPVVNTYSDSKMLESSKSTGKISMEFVYPSTKVGETGQGIGAVKVEDHPARTYVCYGIQGGMSMDEMKEGHAKLKAWLEEHKNEWVVAGEPRRLGYHGPMTPAAERLWEVQIPIKKK